MLTSFGNLCFETEILNNVPFIALLNGVYPRTIVVFFASLFFLFFALQRGNATPTHWLRDPRGLRHQSLRWACRLRSFFCFLSEWLAVLQRSPLGVSCNPFTQAQGSVSLLFGCPEIPFFSFPWSLSTPTHRLSQPYCCRYSSR